MSKEKSPSNANVRDSADTSQVTEEAFPFLQHVAGSGSEGIDRSEHLAHAHGISVSFGKTYGILSFNNRPAEESVGASQLIKARLSGPIDPTDFEQSQLIESILSRQTDFNSLDWRQFESLVAMILEAHGAEIQLTPDARDGGRDIIAQMHGIKGMGPLTFAVEVKHREVVDRPLIQQIVYQNRHFPAVMVVTSGRYSSGALMEAKQPENRMRLFLKDGSELRAMLSAYRPFIKFAGGEDFINYSYQEKDWKDDRISVKVGEEQKHEEVVATEYGNLGNVYLGLGDLDKAETMYRNSLKLVEELGLKEGMARQYSNLGILLRTRDDLDGAEEMYRKALALDEELGSKEGMANQYGNLGNVLFTRGDLDGAEEMYRKSLLIEDELGRKAGIATDYGNLGNVLRARGDLDGAEEMYRKALALDEEFGSKKGMADQFSNLGHVLWARGDVDGAEKMIRKALALDEELGSKKGMANRFGNLGNILKMRGDLDGAEEMYRKALTLDEELGGKEGMANQYGNLGNVLYMRGDLEGARDCLNLSLQLFHEIGAEKRIDMVKNLLNSLDSGR